MKRLAGLCMAFTFQGAHTARESFGSHLSSQRSAAAVGSTLGSSRTASAVASQSTRVSSTVAANASCGRSLCLHSQTCHAGSLPAAAANRAGFRKGSYSLARQQAFSSDLYLSSRDSLKQQQSASSRRTAASCLSTATSSQDVQSTAAFQTPPTYVRANGRIIASKYLSNFACFHPLQTHAEVPARAEKHHCGDHKAYFNCGPILMKSTDFRLHRCLLTMWCAACAVGDIHGDLQKTVTSLKVAGVLEEDRNGRPLWCGGDTVVVQLGDVLDRGDCEIGVCPRQFLYTTIPGGLWLVMHALQVPRLQHISQVYSALPSMTLPWMRMHCEQS